MTIEQIFHTHKDKVLSLCFRYLQQEQEAEDAVQEIFVKVYEKQSSFREEAQVGTWIYRITVNHCLDILKSKKRKKQLMQFVSFLPFLAESKAAANETNHMEQKHAEQKLHQQLLNLPENQLSAIVLNKLEGLPIDKVAAIMNLSYKAVESLLQRGKQNLLKQMNAKE